MAQAGHGTTHDPAPTRSGLVFDQGVVAAVPVCQFLPELRRKEDEAIFFVHVRAEEGINPQPSSVVLSDSSQVLLPEGFHGAQIGNISRNEGPQKHESSVTLAAPVCDIDGGESRIEEDIIRTNRYEFLRLPTEPRDRAALLVSCPPLGSSRPNPRLFVEPDDHAELRVA